MVRSTGMIRKVDELGRIVLPIQIRRSLAIHEKDGLEILLDRENGCIVLKKVPEPEPKQCLKCRSARELKEIKPGYYLCERCMEELSRK